MSWLSTSTSYRAITLALVAAVALGACALPARAQSLESAIMPGAVIKGHIKEESSCKNCHIRFERSAQPRLCLDCHKAVAADVRAKAGYHGRLKERECRSCHTEHKGRDAKIIKLDERAFDHAQTDYALKGKHKRANCSACHKAKTKHSAAPSTCIGCHRKDDKHKDTLGAKCENCHNENRWKEARFDHLKSRFPLLLRHDKIKCVECHADPLRYANTPRDCISCHRKDDKHRNTLGPQCGHCHNEGNWKEARFDHAKTRFPLLRRHAKVKCVECHADVQHYANTPLKCNSCHRKDDKHKGALGEKCETCHNDHTWKEAVRFDHDRDSRYPLREAHRKAKCSGCHKDAHFRDKTPTTCVACHERDDREKGHKGRYGAKCESCHAEKTFKALTFEHERDARYALRFKHQQVKCDDCHKDVLYRDKLATKCFACHEADDRKNGHKGQLGNDCARCHTEKSWRESTFDHARTDYPLRERHAGVECKKCHSSLAYKDARTDCASCHAKDDVHKKRLGPRCETCHSTRGWKNWEYDHNLRARFKLVEKHVKIKCLACHLKPVADKIVLPLDCIGCHKHDDIHFETSGTKCERCHMPDNWRRIINQEGNKRRK